jgi:hypothetical protein
MTASDGAKKSIFKDSHDRASTSGDRTLRLQDCDPNSVALA